MARTNLNTKGSVRVEVIAGPDVQFVAGTNSGLFESINYDGLGVYTMTYARPVAPGDQLLVQIEGATSGSAVNTRLSPTTEQVEVFNTGGDPLGPADRPFNAEMIEQFKG